MYPTKIGKLKLPHFCYNAAGVWDTTWSQCQQLLDTPYCGSIVTKSCTMESRMGNEYPKYHFTDLRYSINSNGLENKGWSYYLQHIRHNTFQHNTFISIGGLSNAERIELLRSASAAYANFDLSNFDFGVELNLSCPNLGHPGPAYSADDLDRALEDIFKQVGALPMTFGLKLPPYYLQYEFDNIAAVLLKYKNYIDFITCINSVPNGLDYDIDNNQPTITPNGGYGGLGGGAILPIALSNVRHFSQLLGDDIVVIGCGGVTSGEDLYKHLLAGAKAVQVGTELWREGPEIFTRLATEFEQIMNRKGYTKLSQIPRN